MDYQITDAIQILERTPQILKTLLLDLPEKWISQNEGENTWSPFDVVGHLVHGEKTDWVVRTKIILNDPNRTFTPFDRFAQSEDSKGKTMNQLLDKFGELRAANLEEFKSLNIQESDLPKVGKHPELGDVTLENILSAWVVHDLGHIGQITRVMAKQYTNEVGPWTQYMGVLN